MDATSMAAWQRVEFDNTPIYIHPEAPDWFVPNELADAALAKLLQQGKGSIELHHLLVRCNGTAAPAYSSRSDQLAIDHLKECWIHITNRCNMSCRHCMFTSAPQATDELTAESCERIVCASYDLGCRLYFFTGGEPFFSKAFLKSVRDILQRSDTHVVVLTNLSLISQAKEQLSDLPRERFHFQVSLDGLQHHHDDLRGANAFDRLCRNLGTLQKLGFPVTLATTVTRNTVSQMAEIVRFAAEQQISNVHFMWLFKKGNAKEAMFVEPGQIFPHLLAAYEAAEAAGVKIDNIESLRSQVFSCPGTRYDLSNAGWHSIAVGPDGFVYPTPALVYTPDMQCGHIREGLQQVWQNSPVLSAIRGASLNHSDAYRRNPFRYLIGGGDIDHSYVYSGQIAGGDPYVELYSDIAKWLISREAKRFDTNGYPALRLKMGEKLGDCPMEGGSIFFTHSNCVLSLPGHDTHTQVNQFYSSAAQDVKEDILNPICYAEDLIQHIPEKMRYRSYGCGSPVLEADVQQGETVVDLGSGTGIECFIAGKLVGPHGKVYGIDMGDAMLAAANKTKESVVANLRYDNIAFKKAFLEELPLEDRFVDLVISNCVLNLSPDKRRVFHEIFRVLKPGGRLMISDITYDDDIPLEIKYNETLRGECIGGALRYQDLFGLMNDVGFSDSKIVKGYPYRTVKGYEFFSATYQAAKPLADAPVVLYDFPDFESTMAAVASEPTCACFQAPVEKPLVLIPTLTPHRSGCLVCGEALVYFQTDKNKSCHYCGETGPANAQCTNGHFVCDACHRGDAVEIIKQVCLHTQEQDPLVLMQTIRSHPTFHVHGPEHHALVPAVLLAAIRNNGHLVSDDQILTGIQRGQTIAGGACAFLGACGAAIGVGIAFSVLTGATPYDGEKRQAAQRVTQKTLERIASYTAPRCCQRDSWLALQVAAEFIKETFGVTLKLDDTFFCQQFAQNKECIHDQCPLWPKRR